MNSKRVRHRFQRALPTLWAAFACADVIGEAVRRELARSGAGAVAPGLAESSGRLFALLGRGLLRQLRELVAVDARYQALRARQRRLQARRDRIARRLYRETTDGRRFLKGLLGYEGACRYLGFRGPTAREARTLFHQAGEAVEHAKRQEPPESPPFGHRAAEAKKVVAAIGAVVKELDAAIDDVVRGHCQVDAAMLAQRRAMKVFDRTYRESARTLEAQLVGAGLPTLGDAVRPGVGRRGRPLKRRPVDLHPDLVARVRAEGLMALDLAARLAAPPAAAEPDAEPAAAGDRLAEPAAERPAPADSAEEPEDQAVEPDDPFSSLILPPPVAACTHHARRYRPGAPRRRAERPSADERTRLGRLRKAASTWWGRLRPVG